MSVDTRMTYSNYWVGMASQHIKEFTGDKPLSSIALGHMLISGALSEMVASAMVKAFEHVEQRAEANLIEGIGGHRNGTGGWCSPQHGNTCGLHPEFDRWAHQNDTTNFGDKLLERLDFGDILLEHSDAFTNHDAPIIIDGSELVSDLGSNVALTDIANAMIMVQALRIIQSAVKEEGKLLKITLEHAADDTLGIVVDITVEHGPNDVFSDINFDTMSDAFLALAKHLQEIK